MNRKTIKIVVDAVEREYKPSNISVDVLYCDEDIAVADKPAGMPCHPSRGHPYDSLANALASDKKLAGKVFRPIGRLDKDTSGAVVCALHAHSAYYLTENRPDKLYLAIVYPPPAEDEGIIEAPIARQSEDSIKRCVDPKGQYALTKYKILIKNSRCAVAILKIETGRTHQIRVHMSYIGSPLVGDELYLGNCTKFKRHALHCCAVQFKSNADSEVKKVISPLPDDIKKYLTEEFGEQAVFDIEDNIKSSW